MTFRSLFILLIIGLFSNCDCTNNTETNEHNVVEKSIRLMVDGMHCDSCKLRIEKRLLSEKGIRKAEVFLDGHYVDINYDINRINIENIVSILKEMNFKVTNLDARQN